MTPMNATTGTRVLLVDDHALLRLALREELEGIGIEICGEAADAEAALALAEQTRPDICLVDLYMPDASDGLALTRDLASRYPTTAVVVLTASWLKVDLKQALAAGARGYLLKDDDPSLLRNQLDEIRAGRRVVSTGMPGKSSLTNRSTAPVSMS
jgi:two-component system, NarL family, response regulator DevR